MLSAFKVKKFAAAVTFACASIFASATPVYADEGLRQDLEQALSNMKTVHLRLQELGHINDASEGLLQIENARKALANTTDETLSEASKSVHNMDAVMNIDETVLDAINGVQNQQFANVVDAQLGKSFQSLSSAVPTTSETLVDTESLSLLTCQDQLALQASVTALDSAYFIAALASEIVPEDITTLGQSLPNPVKIALTVIKYAAKVAKFSLEQTIKLNAICLARNERKIAREYIQARQVRYTPHKTIEAKFDVVRPINLGGKNGYRYTFWMHLTKDGRATSADVTKIMASELSDENSTYVTLDESLYTVTYVEQGLYKLTLDTPTAQGLDYVRGFVLHMEKSNISPGNAPYTHYGVAHIRSDVNSKSF